MMRGGLLAAVVAALVLALPASALAAGPTSIAVDSDGTSYAGFASGAVDRVSASGVPLAQWPTPVGDANGSLGPVMAIDVGASESNPNGRNVWVLDANRRVQEFGRDGTFIRGFQLADCEGGNVPEPAREGGISVTHDQIYVAHPCGNTILRYTIASLPASGFAAAAPAAITGGVHAPHGIAGPDTSVPDAQYHYLYVAQPKDEAIRWFDPLTLVPRTEGTENPIPCLTKSGPVEDVFALNSAGLPRLYFAESDDDDTSNRHKIFAAQASGDTAPYNCGANDQPFDEAFNFGGLGSAPGQFNDPVAFDIFATIAPASTHALVADRLNERVQRITAGGPDNGNPVWSAAAADPGPPQAGSGGSGGTGGAGGTGGTGGGTTGGSGTVAINGGDAFTRSPDVSLTVSEPAGTTAVDISNSGDFAGFQRRSLDSADTYSWTLDTEGSDRVPKRVNVRFQGTTAPAVFDEITLDRRAPLVGDPTIEKRRRRGKRPRWVLRVPATDEVSGLDRLEFGPERNGDFKSRAFKSPLRVEDKDDALYIRVTDVAGNVSKTRRVLRAR